MITIRKANDRGLTNIDWLHSLHNIAEGHKGWVQVIKGQVLLNNHALRQGDGASIENEQDVSVNCLEDAEFLLFDLGYA